MGARTLSHPSRLTAVTAGALALSAFAWLVVPTWAEDAKPASPAPAPAAHSTTTPAQAQPAAPAPVSAKVPVTKSKSPASAPANAVTRPQSAAPVVPTVPVPKSKTVAPAPSKTAGVTTQQPVAAQPAVPAPSKTNTAAKTPPVPGKSGSTGVQPTAQLDEQVTYQYNALGRRDPFQPLIGGEYVGVDVGGDAPPDIGGIKVVGIVWGDADKFALVEDGRGESHVLRRGDKVMNGFVESLSREGIVVSLTADGQTQSVTIPLTRKGEKAK